MPTCDDEACREDGTPGLFRQLVSGYGYAGFFGYAVLGFFQSPMAARMASSARTEQ